MKIRIALRKNGKVVYRYPSMLKFNYFVRNKAKTLVKNGTRIDLLVAYKPGFNNEMKRCSVNDLEYCYQAFIREYL